MAKSRKVDSATHRLFRANLLRLSKERGWSLVQLADFAGLTRARVYDMMDGHGSPTLRTLEKLAIGLGVPVADLLRAPASMDI